MLLLFVFVLSLGEELLEPHGVILLLIIVGSFVDVGKNMEDGNDDFLLQTENEIIVENMNVVEDQIVGVDGVVMPEVGMMFSSKKEMFEFCK